MVLSRVTLTAESKRNGEFVVTQEGISVRSYIRVSTEEQADEGFSIPAQKDRLDAFVKSQGWILQESYIEEGASAKNMDRPQLRRLLTDLASKEKQTDVVLVYRLDRLTRSVVDLYTLLSYFDRHNVKFRSATEVYDTTTAIGRLFITLVGALAQWERENLGERTKLGQIEMTRQGKWSGGHRPFGYIYENGQLVVQPEEADLITSIFERYTSGGQGTHRLLRWLNDPAQPQISRGRHWTLTALRYVLDNPLYAGFVRYNYRTPSGRRQKSAIIEPGQHEAIITEETFRAAQELRCSRSAQPRRSGTGTFSLTGLLRCALCGATLVGETKYRTNKNEGSPRRYYVCVNRAHSGACRLPIIQAQTLEETALSEIDRYYNDMSSLAGNVIANHQTLEEQIQQLSDQLATIEAKQRRWLNAYEEGVISAGQLRQRLDGLRRNEQSIEQKRASLQEKQYETVDMEFLRSVLSSFRGVWGISTNAERKELARLIIERIIVFEGPEIRLTFRQHLNRSMDQGSHPCQIPDA